jgi:leucyl aminopeptidase
MGSMNSLKLSTTTKLPKFSDKDALVIGVKPDSKGNPTAIIPTVLESSDLAAVVAQLNLSALGASSALESLTRYVTPSGVAVALIGLGKRALSVDDYRALAGAAVRQLGSFARIHMALEFAHQSSLVASFEGAAVANYEFVQFKGDTKPKRAITEISALTSLKLPKIEADRILVLSHAVHQTRDLVNTPPNDLFPAAVASAATKHAKDLPVKVTVWDEKKLQADNMVGILAVGAGSVRGPRLVKIEYAPKGAKKKLALVGKGITFDSGGLSLKPPTSMIGMKYDMTGAATVMQTVLAIAKLGLPVKVTAWLCLAENLPSGSATRPNDIIRYRNGKTVEITNTDAEGRLVLADGLISASAEQPDLIVDVATLTGAATVALGNRYAGLMGTSVAVEAVKDAAATAGELVWHMPLAPELKKNLEGETADLINAKLGNPAGGMLVGGLFLQEFVGVKRGSTDPEDILEWAHLDIAGPANNDVAAYGYIGKGASGSYVRTLVALAESMI